MKNNVIRTALIVMAASMLLSACMRTNDASQGQPHIIEVVQTVLVEPTPVRVIETVIVEVLAATKTPQPTATPKPSVHDTSALKAAMDQAGPGEVVIDPDRNHEGQVEIREENERDFFDYLLDAIVIINPEYFEKLNTQFSAEVTDGASLWQFLEGNSYMLPLIDGEGMRLARDTFGAGYIGRSYPLDKVVRLRNLGVMFIGEDEQAEIVRDYNAEDQLLKDGTMFAGATMNEGGFGLRIGFGRHVRADEAGGEYYELSVQVVKKENTNNNNMDVGFPEAGPLKEGDIERLDEEIRFALLALRATSTKPFPMEPFHQISTESGGYTRHNKAGLADKQGMIEVFTPALYEEFISTDYEGAPPEILELVDH